MDMASTTAKTAVNSDPLTALCRAVAEDLSLLCLLHDVEPDKELLSLLRKDGFSQLLGLRLRSEQGLDSLHLFDQSLTSLPEKIDSKTMDQLAADYASIYLNYGIQASPQESVWTDEESLTCQSSMFQVRNCYERHGLGVEDWRKRPDDHLVFELRFIQHLFESGSALEAITEIARFMDEHLLRWLMPFAQRVSARCETAYFAAAALVTATYCEELRDLLADVLEQPRPTVAEIDERMRPSQPEEEVPQQYVPGIGPAV